jgi:hypothetical protein
MAALATLANIYVELNMAARVEADSGFRVFDAAAQRVLDMTRHP